MEAVKSIFCFYEIQVHFNFFAGRNHVLHKRKNRPLTVKGDADKDFFHNLLQEGTRGFQGGGSPLYEGSFITLSNVTSLKMPEDRQHLHN